MSGLNDYRKMNPLAAAPLAELNFEAIIGELKPGYKRCSTFAADFSIADSFGVEAVEDAFNRAFNEWKDDSKMMAEMSMVLNHNIWRYYEIDTALARTYDRCWREADSYFFEKSNNYLINPKSNIMSVTVKNEISKAEVLVSGLKKHLDEVKQLGITADEIKKMEELSQTLLQKDEEVEALRREANEKGRENRELLAELKEQMFTFRKAVKQRYMQSDWIKYGVQDKR